MTEEQAERIAKALENLVMIASAAFLQEDEEAPEQSNTVMTQQGRMEIR